MNKKFTFILCVLALMLLSSCSSTQEKKVSPTNTLVTKNVSTVKPSVSILNDTDTRFMDIDTTTLPKIAIPLTKSPDNTTIFYMERTDKVGKTDDKTKILKALKGDTHQNINLIALNISTGKKNIISEGTPFISYCKWNTIGNMVAFCGGERLTVYDTEKNKLLLEDSLIHDRVTYFGWSPDGNSIYTEHSNLINGTIYNFKDGKTLHCYETDIRLYYKGTYGNNRYFATENLIVDEVEQKKSGGRLNESRTVLTDSTGNVLKSLSCGRFRDYYKNAVLQIGESGFGLQYYEDLEKPESREITKEYVYDVKFALGGYFLYTVKSYDVEKNIFMLCICDDKGNEKARVPVTGPYISITPDGGSAYTSGPLNEIIDLEYTLNNVEKVIHEQNEKIGRIYDAANEEVKLFKALRGAMDTYLKFRMADIKDYDAAVKYYINSENPPQMGFFDITTTFNDRKSHFIGSDCYVTDIFISKMSQKGDRASVVVNGICRNSAGAGSGVGSALEMIKKDSSWYVTGFSTFPDSKKAKDLKVKVDKIIKDMEDGKLFEGKFKGMDVRIGQIQFWQMSDPTLSTNVDHSNYCKVYLKVLEGGKEMVYKMVLSKEKSWAPSPPVSDRLSWL
ncbi:hypothetical protein [Pseudobacteroides cellulosolvens]|uniref:WD40-like beta Propeller containing protein n=1 Tax=Pseudobacteroides cellulosolvens ATCC 35603 = DSM 2933 TaxID=398512 RepID=A0A0L6JJY0_9FIRM|nr:hypothetical protein [Pseudobacteroides cellulosolvens]KNY26013.1 hypothetical protein Bccel_1275 [Pseudobacteroides cellulosolvens ATCC 35603 = DSM 2933]